MTKTAGVLIGLAAEVQSRRRRSRCMQELLRFFGESFQIIHAGYDQQQRPSSLHSPLP
jgi:hypothetical protein